MEPDQVFFEWSARFRIENGGGLDASWEAYESAFTMGRMAAFERERDLLSENEALRALIRTQREVLASGRDA